MIDTCQDPVYPISVAARKLEVCSATLRIWEKKGLIKPSRLGTKRFYSEDDIEKLGYIKELMQKEGVNIQGVKNILNTTRCWEVKKCHPKERDVCPVYIKYGPQ